MVCWTLRHKCSLKAKGQEQHVSEIKVNNSWVAQIPVSNFISIPFIWDAVKISSSNHPLNSHNTSSISVPQNTKEHCLAVTYSMILKFIGWVNRPVNFGYCWIGWLEFVLLDFCLEKQNKKVFLRVKQTQILHLLVINNHKQMIFSSRKYKSMYYSLL